MSDIAARISSLIDASGPGHVWVPADFAQLGSRDVIDKTLQRMTLRDQLRRIDRGLYDKPVTNRLTQRTTTPDYRAIIDAIARRDNLRILVDGMTAANDLGLTDAVPAHVIIYTDTRRRAIQLDNLPIEFRLCAPSRLYWAGRPAMRLVQALHWLKDTLPSDSGPLRQKIGRLLIDKKQGAAIRDDLIQGFSALPIWMQDYLRPLLDLSPDAKAGDKSTPAKPKLHHDLPAGAK
ncbi:DUF6088 family protein [Variovorax sp. RT4R15]|uniref:DUF6088 family protein n=1 Tax=Variovorax sp. RT4R15 TaxID=3443737 RepID=UPI003F47F659